MKPEDLRIFLATLQTGSFTGAATRLMLSKQFVSRRMEALEADLGVQLFVRNTRQLRVTETGQAFQTHASYILDAITSAKQAIESRRERLQGTLKISVPVSFGIRFLSPVIAEFAKQYPAVQVQIEVTDNTVDLISMDFDLAVRIDRLPDSTLIARKVGDMHRMVCCSPEYARKHALPATPQDLVHHKCLLHSKDVQNGWAFVQDGQPQTVKVTGPLVATNNEFIRGAAIASCGIALLPEFLASEAIRDGTLLPILEAYPPPPLQISIVYPQHRQGSRLIDALQDFIRNHLSLPQPPPSRASPVEELAAKEIG